MVMEPLGRRKFPSPAHAGALPPHPRDIFGKMKAMPSAMFGANMPSV